MTSASIIALLQAALSLLTLVQSNPNIPQSLQTTAIQTAEQAISAATAGFSANSAVQNMPNPVPNSTPALTATPITTNQPSATIDQANSTVYATPTNGGAGNYSIPGFSGTASGVNEIRIVIRNGSYSGPTDFNTASCGGTTVFGPYCANTPDINPPGIYSPPVGYSLPLGLHTDVSNNRWQVASALFNTANGALPSQLTVLVYDGDTGNNLLQFLGETTVTVVAQ